MFIFSRYNKIQQTNKQKLTEVAKQERILNNAIKNGNKKSRKKTTYVCSKITTQLWV